MTEMVTSGSMSGAEKRSDGLLGESDYERRRSLSAPPGLYATALRLDSTAGIAAIVQHACRSLTGQTVVPHDIVVVEKDPFDPGFVGIDNNLRVLRQLRSNLLQRRWRLSIEELFKLRPARVAFHSNPKRFTELSNDLGFGGFASAKLLKAA
jgi:hypothetical protein